MAKRGKLLIREQAKSVLLAYLACDNTDGYLQMTFAMPEAGGYIEIKETNDYDLVITRIVFGNGETEVFETIEDFAEDYGLLPQLRVYHGFIQAT